MKSVLVFCEGHHDVVFAQRSLAAHGDCQWVDRHIGDLPSPFGRDDRTARKGLIATRIEKREIEATTIQAGTRPAAPFFASIVESVSSNTIYFLINSLGKDKARPNLDLLRDIDLTVNEMPPGTFQVSEYSVAFLFDANSEGVSATLSGFCGQYQGHFGDLSTIGHGTWVTGTTVPVGCFVFHRGPQDDQGTLEDHLAPMVKGVYPELYSAAEHFVNDNRRSDDEVSRGEAMRLKAVITTTGQFKNPGAPMSETIGRKGIPSAQFRHSPLSAELADFLVAAPWRRE